MERCWGGGRAPEPRRHGAAGGPRNDTLLKPAGKESWGKGLEQFSEIKKIIFEKSIQKNIMQRCIQKALVILVTVAELEHGRMTCGVL